MNVYDVYFYISHNIEVEHACYQVIMATLNSKTNTYDEQVLCNCYSLAKAILIVDCCNTIYK